MHTSRGLGRIVGFADGVVAIAITLLILPLVDEASTLTGDVGAFLVENAQELLVFAISFIVIGRFWLIHHAMFEYVTDYTPGLVWATLMWLLTIVFLPFPTELLATSPTGSGLTHGIYVGTMFLTTVASAVQMRIIIKHPEIQAEAVRGKLRLQPSIIAVVTLLVATIVAYAVPGTGLFALLLLAVGSPISAVVDRIRGRSKVAE